MRKSINIVTILDKESRARAVVCVHVVTVGRETTVQKISVGKFNVSNEMCVTAFPAHAITSFQKVCELIGRKVKMTE